MSTFLSRMTFVYLRPHWKWCLLIFLCMLSAIAFDSLFPLGLTFLIDRAIVPQDGAVLVRLIGAMAALYVVSSLSNFALDYLRIGLVAGLRLPLFAVASKPLAGRATELSARAREAEGEITGTVQESIQAQAIARAFELDQ
jgi:ABC-type bacteriocin/lantibiotic exporter with double-glycine peptidase domain